MAKKKPKVKLSESQKGKEAIVSKTTVSSKTASVKNFFKEYLKEIIFGVSVASITAILFASNNNIFYTTVNVNDKTEQKIPIDTHSPQILDQTIEKKRPLLNPIKKDTSVEMISAKVKTKDSTISNINYTREYFYKIAEDYYYGKNGKIKNNSKALEYYEKAYNNGFLNAKDKINELKILLK